MSEPTIADRLIALQNSVNDLYAAVHTISTYTTSVSTAFLSGQLNDIRATQVADVAAEQASLNSIDAKLTETPSV